MDRHTGPIPPPTTPGWSGAAPRWATDIDIKAARWGHPTRHRIGDACAREDVFPETRFDAVICNGVFGFGVDTPQMQARSWPPSPVLKPHGLLLLGWNTGQSVIRSRQPDRATSYARHSPDGRRARRSRTSPTSMIVLRKRWGAPDRAPSALSSSAHSLGADHHGGGVLHRRLKVRGKASKNQRPGRAPVRRVDAGSALLLCDEARNF